MADLGSKKRILHISKYYYPFSGGTEQIARDSVAALKDAYEQRVIAFAEGRRDESTFVDGVSVVKCSCLAVVDSQPLSLSYAGNLKRILREFNPDVIIFHYPNPFVAFFLLKYLRKLDAGREQPVRFILYWHLDIVRQKILGRLFGPQNMALLERADCVIATSPNYIDGSPWLSRFKDKCVVIPNCINAQRMRITQEDEDKARRIRGENEGRTICIAVGRHTAYKGYRYLIQAGKLLDQRYRFYLVGSGELSGELKRQAAGDERFVFTGRLDEGDLRAHMLAADIICFPSVTKNEAFGLSLAEGMYYGKPAVTFHIPGSGVNYVCIAGEDGIEVENRDIEAYADAIRQLAGNPDLRDQYGSNGRRRVEENFLNDRFMENIRIAVAAVIEAKPDQE